MKGQIKSITDFGVFVGLEGGIDGLIHLTDLSWTRAGEEAVRDLKKGDELEAALNAVISASADDIAKQVLPGLEKYQKVGEGYYETAIRVAYSTEVVQASLKGIGKGFDRGL